MRTEVQLIAAFDGVRFEADVELIFPRLAVGRVCPAL